jgi:PD-(D/E)XK nuclease superfamily
MEGTALVHKISPSSLTFLFESCQRCWYHDRLKIWRRPHTPFPSVFSNIDRIMRDYYEGRCMTEIDPTSAPAVISTKKLRVTSAPIELPGCREPVVLAGELDALAYLNRSTVKILDFKTSNVKPESASIYGRQLNAYADILLHPVKQEYRSVHSAGLVTVVPQSMSAGGLFHMESSYVELEIDLQGWRQWLATAVRLLEGPPPPAAEGCFWCELQQVQEKRG